MYLSEFIKDVVNQHMQAKCVGHPVEFKDESGSERTIFCQFVEVKFDDGDVWIEFTDDKNLTYIASGQGADIWFDIKK